MVLIDINSFFLIKEDPLALIFTSIFILNLTIEKLINIITLKNRINADDLNFKRLLNLKIIIFEILLPLIFILNIDQFENTFNFSILFISLSTLLTFFIIIFAYKNKAYPKIMSTRLFSGIVYKKMDGLFIRLFTGYFWGFSSLGTIQPALSIARSITIVTPIWISLNLNSFFISSVNNLSIRNFIWIPLSYFTYLLISIIAWNLLQIFNINDFTYSVFLLAFLWFGNANTKAIIRGISVFNDFLENNNNSLIVSLAFKFLTAFFIPTGAFFELFILLISIDFIVIAMLLYCFYIKSLAKMYKDNSRFMVYYYFGLVQPQ